MTKNRGNRASTQKGGLLTTKTAQESMLWSPKEKTKSRNNTSAGEPSSENPRTLLPRAADPETAWPEEVQDQASRSVNGKPWNSDERWVNMRAKCSTTFSLDEKVELASTLICNGL